MRDKCIGKTAQSILGDGGGAVAQGSLVSACCSAKAMFSCHYRGELRCDHDDVLVYIYAIALLGASIKLVLSPFNFLLCCTEYLYKNADKPSKEPCPNAPLIDPVMGKPFW